MLESIPELTFPEVKLLAQIMGQDLQILKTLKGLANDEIARLLRDSESYQTYVASINRPKVIKVAPPAPVEEEEANDEF